MRREEREGAVRRARQRCQSPRERHDTLSDEQRYKVVVSGDRRKRPLLATRVCVRFPFMCVCVCFQKPLGVRAGVHVCGDAVWPVLCVIETVKSERNEFLNIICSWVSGDRFFASVHHGGKITLYSVRLCAKVKKSQEEGALHTL